MMYSSWRFCRLLLCVSVVLESSESLVLQNAFVQPEMLSFTTLLDPG